LHPISFVLRFLLHNRQQKISLQLKPRASADYKVNIAITTQLVNPAQTYLRRILLVSRTSAARKEHTGSISLIRRICLRKFRMNCIAFNGFSNFLHGKGRHCGFFQSFFCITRYQRTHLVGKSPTTRQCSLEFHNLITFVCISSTRSTSIRG
jgi:hypothetical protein